MKQAPANHTVARYLPVIQAIYANLELELLHHGEFINGRDHFEILGLEQDFKDNLAYATMLLSVWLEGTAFEAKYWQLVRTSSDARWEDLLKIIDAKIIDFHNKSHVIEIGLHRNGRTVRTVAGKEIVHDFGTDGHKKEVITLLAQMRDYVKPALIQGIIGSKSEESVVKTVQALNAQILKKLQLPRQHKFIDSKRGLGYRINPIYNVVFLD